MKNIPDYNGDYAVNDSGDVFSLKFGKCKKLKPALNGKGYHIVVLCKDGKMKTHKVHRLVAQAFLDDYSKDLQVDHIDNNRINNKLENLRMLSNQKNHFNRPKTKGYTWRKNRKKWIAQITVNYKVKHLGCFDTEAEAREAYLNAKEILHII
jgi:hypothetical protein